jgi:hypothetical protein
MSFFCPFQPSSFLEEKANDGYLGPLAELRRPFDGDTGEMGKSVVLGVLAKSEYLPGNN